MFDVSENTKYKCLKCKYIGFLNFEYESDQDVTYRTFYGHVKCDACETSLDCYGTLDIYDGDRNIYDEMEWLMSIDFEGSFEKHFLNEEDLEAPLPGPRPLDDLDAPLPGSGPLDDLCR